MNNQSQNLAKNNIKQNQTIYIVSSVTIYKQQEMKLLKDKLMIKKDTKIKNRNQ